MAGLGACQLHEGAPVTPERAVAACRGPVTLALRSRDAELRAVELAPADATRVERRRANAGRQPIAVVVEGAGAARKDGSFRGVRYLCLLDPAGAVVFVDAVNEAGARDVVDECGGAASARRGCLADRLRAADRALGAAEAAALTRVDPERRGTVEEPLATSIGAWRVYRDAECARRAADAPEDALACRVVLTRLRAAELAG